MSLWSNYIYYYLKMSRNKIFNIVYFILYHPPLKNHGIHATAKPTVDSLTYFTVRPLNQFSCLSDAGTVRIMWSHVITWYHVILHFFCYNYATGTTWAWVRGWERVLPWLREGTPTEFPSPKPITQTIMWFLSIIACYRAIWVRPWGTCLHAIASSLPIEQYK